MSPATVINKHFMTGAFKKIDSMRKKEKNIKVKFLYLHSEESFVESTNIWLTQQDFSFKYG